MGVRDTVVYLKYEEFEAKIKEVADNSPDVVRELVEMSEPQTVKDKGTRFFKYQDVVYAETI